MSLSTLSRSILVLPIVALIAATAVVGSLAARSNPGARVATQTTPTGPKLGTAIDPIGIAATPHADAVGC